MVVRAPGDEPRPAPRPLGSLSGGAHSPLCLDSLAVNGRVADRIGIGKGITGTVNSGIGRIAGRDVVVGQNPVTALRQRNSAS